MTDAAATSEITVVPANEASWEDLQAVLGTRGGAAVCQCQRFKLQPKESFGSTPDFLKRFPQGALPGAWRQMKDVQLNPNTAIAPKYKELIGLAVVPAGA